jgi:hypothetical protein
VSKKQKLYAGKIPFNVFGNQLHYPEGGIHELKAENFKEDGVYLEDGWPRAWRKVFFQEYVIRFEPKIGRWADKNAQKDVIGSVSDIELDNYVFEDTLKYDTYSRGRSAGYFHFVSISNGRQYTVFMTDFGKIVENMVRGVVKGKFTFCKRGANFGMIMID